MYRGACFSWRALRMYPNVVVAVAVNTEQIIEREFRSYDCWRESVCGRVNHVKLPIGQTERPTHVDRFARPCVGAPATGRPNCDGSGAYQDVIGGPANGTESDRICAPVDRSAFGPASGGLGLSAHKAHNVRTLSEELVRTMYIDRWSGIGSLVHTERCANVKHEVGQIAASDNNRRSGCGWRGRASGCCGARKAN